MPFKRNLNQHVIVILTASLHYLLNIYHFLSFYISDRQLNVIIQTEGIPNLYKNIHNLYIVKNVLKTKKKPPSNRGFFSGALSISSNFRTRKQFLHPAPCRTLLQTFASLTDIVLLRRNGHRIRRIISLIQNNFH